MENDPGQCQEEGLEDHVPPPADGLRRSRRLRNQLPPPLPPRASDSGSKRPRRQQEVIRKVGGDGDADDNKVKIKVNPTANVKAVGEAEGGKEKTGTGERSLLQHKLPRLEETKVGGSGSNSKVQNVTPNDENEEAVSPGYAGSGAGRSDVLTSSGNAHREVGRAPSLTNSGFISKAPVGQQVAVVSDSAVLESPPAPLQNSVVLSHLFEVCPPAALAKFRLVCKEWRDLSLMTWRKSATLKLECDITTREITIEGGTSLNQFVGYVEDPRNECAVKPFRRIKLKGWHFDSSNREMERFWTLTGRYLTSLDLSYCSSTDDEVFWKIPYVICPNLAQLRLEDCWFGSWQNVDNSSESQLKYKEPVRGKHEHLKYLVVAWTDLPVSWLELLSHFESLTSLEVEPEFGEQLGDMLNAIKVIRKQDGNKLPLKAVDLGPGLTMTTDDKSQEQFILVRELNLPLKSLTAVVHTDPRLDLQLVSAILELQAGTLETLKVYDYDSSDSASGEEWKFPCPLPLEKLQNLHIENFFWESTEILKSAPNLRTLSIEDGWGGNLTNSLFDTMTDGHPDNTPALLPKLTKLTLGDFGRREDLVTLAKLTPNVEELRITLVDKDQEFAIVCGNWKRLQVLTLTRDKYHHYGSLSDEGVTGGGIQIEKPDMKWVHKAMRPTITDLKELRSFSCDSDVLTGISVYHGFLQLPNLQTLTLSSTYERDDSDHENGSLKSLIFGEQSRTDLRERGITLNLIL